MRLTTTEFTFSVFGLAIISAASAIASTTFWQLDAISQSGVFGGLSLIAGIGTIIMIIVRNTIGEDYNHTNQRYREKWAANRVRIMGFVYGTALLMVTIMLTGVAAARGWHPALVTTFFFMGGIEAAVLLLMYLHGSSKYVKDSV